MLKITHLGDLEINGILNVPYHDSIFQQGTDTYKEAI